VTDLPIGYDHLPTRLGVTLHVEDDGRLTGVLSPVPAMCDRGVVPMAALVFLTDAVTGVPVDTDPETWTFTADLTVRVPLTPIPGEIRCTSAVLRSGARSSISEAPLLADGELWGHCFAGFSRVPRREGDPVKMPFDPATLGSRMASRPLDEPLRAAARFRSLDPAHGTVSAALDADLLNPAGTLQGAMVAGLAETAAEDLADHLRLLGTDRHVVTEIEMRFLAQNRVSPIVSAAWVVGPPSAGVIRVDLVDDGGRGRLTTSVLLRVQPAPT
jgi:acyl-coenzyme A thioesterase PaaI-like protein